MLEKGVTCMEAANYASALNLELSMWIHGFIDRCWSTHILSVMYTDTLQLDPPRRVEAVSTRRPSSWFPTPFSTKWSWGSLKEWLIPGLEQRKYDMSLQHFVMSDHDDIVNLKGNLSKGHICWRGEVPTVQVWKNLRLKINKDSNGLQFTEWNRKPWVYIDMHNKCINKL